MIKREKIYFSPDMLKYFVDEKFNEVGLSFKGEAKINDDLSIVTDKEIALGNLEETKKTYLKVMEMRELTEEEQKYANKAHEFLSKMFEIMFYNKKLIVAWTLFVSTTLGIDISMGNFLNVLVKSIILLLINRPIKFVKEIFKMFQRDVKLEELEEFLREQHVLGYVDSVDDKNDIKMYAKLRNE